MPRSKDVSQVEIGQILAWHQDEHSQSEIARCTGLSQPAISKILKRHQESGSTNTKRKNCGRKTILNDRDCHHLGRLIKEDCFQGQ